MFGIGLDLTPEELASVESFQDSKAEFENDPIASRLPTRPAPRCGPESMRNCPQLLMRTAL